MKKKLMLLVTVLAIGTLIFGMFGSGAWYSDTEATPNNAFTAGSLDLQLSGSQSLPFSVVNVVPGQSGMGKVTLSNVDCSIPGTLNVSLANMVHSENLIIEPEVGLNGEYTPDLGELGIFLNFTAFVDVNQNGTYDSGDFQLSYNGVHPYSSINYFAGWKLWPGRTMGPWNNVMTLACDQSVDLVIMYDFPTESQDSNYSQNISMTDGLKFDVVFTLTQVHP